MKIVDHGFIEFNVGDQTYSISGAGLVMFATAVCLLFATPTFVFCHQIIFIAVSMVTLVYETWKMKFNSTIRAWIGREWTTFLVGVLFLAALCVLPGDVWIGLNLGIFALASVPTNVTDQPKFK